MIGISGFFPSKAAATAGEHETGSLACETLCVPLGTLNDSDLTGGSPCFQILVLLIVLFTALPGDSRITFQSRCSGILRVTDTEGQLVSLVRDAVCQWSRELHRGR